MTSVTFAESIETPVGLLTASIAQPADFGAIVTLIDDAAKWLHGRGVTNQWPTKQPAHIMRRRLAYIQTGSVYLFRHAETPVSTMRLIWSDKQLWSEEADNACYLHSFAMAYSFHGKGVGAELIIWAANTARQNGRRYLRLDCLATNTGLNAYYRRQGFVYRGESDARVRPASLYEMDLS